MSKPTKAQLAAWREARVQNYISTRSIDSLARMVVDLEGDCAEFTIDEEWPAAVRSMNRTAKVTP